MLTDKREGQPRLAVGREARRKANIQGVLSYTTLYITELSVLWHMHPKAQCVTDV